MVWWLNWVTYCMGLALGKVMHCRSTRPREITSFDENHFLTWFWGKDLKTGHFQERKETEIFGSPFSDRENKLNKFHDKRILLELGMWFFIYLNQLILILTTFSFLSRSHEEYDHSLLWSVEWFIRLYFVAPCRIDWSFCDPHRL